MVLNVEEIIARELKQIKHPLIDSSKTKVIVQDESKKIGLELFDQKGDYISKNFGHPPYYFEYGITLLLNDNELKIDYFYLRDDYQKKGIGKTFLEEVTKLGKRLGIRNLRLKPETNKASQYWGKRGFKKDENSSNEMIKYLN